MIRNLRTSQKFPTMQHCRLTLRSRQFRGVLQFLGGNRSKTNREPQKKTNSWTNRSNNGSWRSSGEESTKQATDSPFRSWNKKEQLKKEKAEKVIIKPHCELFLTNLPPAMRSIAGLAAFFHPYGEVAQIQMIAPNDDIPEAVMKWR